MQKSRYRQKVHIKSHFHKARGSSRSDINGTLSLKLRGENPIGPGRGIATEGMEKNNFIAKGHYKVRCCGAREAPKL
jgi:hypothetical protein